jgi:di/tricarboxylate transporter
MDWQAWATLAVVAAMLVALARELAPPDLILLAALFTLAALGILTPSEVFRGFGNEGMATVGALFVVAAALTETGALEGFAARVFGQVRGERGGLLRICMPVAGLSAFLNNTPIVAMMTPVVIDWARRQRISPSRFLLPMDFATILGGCVTLIGTSTNLVVAGLVLQAGMEPMGFFELAPVGLPVAAVGMLYLVVIAPRVLPARRELMEQLGDQRREYTVSMRVDPAGPLVGRSVSEAALRSLPGLFLVEVDRGSHAVTPVGPDEVLQAGDRLVFAGVVSTIVDVQRIRGLLPVASSMHRTRPRAPCTSSRPWSHQARRSSARASARPASEASTMPPWWACTETASAWEGRSARSCCGRATRCCSRPARPSCRPTATAPTSTS